MRFAGADEAPSTSSSRASLSILQWAHFVPAYDQWLDNTYIKQWGEKNDVQVKIDHINNALLPSAAAASEVAAQKGHDMLPVPLPALGAREVRRCPLNDIVQEVTKKLGKMTDVAYKSTYNPKTKRYFGFADNYVPDPIHYRKSMWFNVGHRPEHVGERPQGGADAEEGRTSRRARDVERARLEHDPDVAPLLLRRRRSRTVERPTRRSTSRARSTALKLMKDIYKNGMSDEVFAWTAASNNQAFLAGRLSMAVNAISIARSAEDVRQHRALGRHVDPADPARAGARARERARDGHLLHLEVRPEPGGGEEVPHRPAVRLSRTTSSSSSSTTSPPGRTRSRAASRR